MTPSPGTAPPRLPVHRPHDGELVGRLSAERRDGADVWVAHTLFGVELATFGGREEAAGFLHARGLAVLAERWWWTSPEEGRVPVTLVEARPDAVTFRLELDPASPLRTVSGAALASLSRTPD
ncbi:hypothetical protein [Trujillonella endophytica]|uniref:Uncharacterized protein n=1 Tax=Trujillonella endophytica TaxID=673521 RepID=A0A1H8UMB6_9ACTN|nr:hypothetical protein [Trujillella endophytica]SEP04370.1 hypothetical protein SAMN05660991_02948 [Trujillella endophytica]